MIGTEIGSYRILEQIGQGGMGVVYKAVDTGLDRFVAMKVLNPDLSRNPELVSRFRAEAKAQANLNHTNLATLYAFLVQDGTAVMVMEYVDGETFAQMIRRRGPIPEQEAVPLFRQALLGIGYAHRAGILHRDIKPSNLMLNKNGLVKVMDFGIAKVMGVQGMTRTGTQLGTLAYMSPEQIQNRNVDIRSDIYELGITLYEMLTGHLPFEGDSEFQIMQDHVYKAPPPPRTYYPYLGEGIERVVLKSIEKNSDARYQTVEHFGAALEHPDLIEPTPAVHPADEATASMSVIQQPRPSTSSARPLSAAAAPPTAPRVSAPVPSHVSASVPPPASAPVAPAYGGGYAGATRIESATIVQPQTAAPASAVASAHASASAAQAPIASGGSSKKLIIGGVCLLVVLLLGVAAYQMMAPVSNHASHTSGAQPTSSSSPSATLPETAAGEATNHVPDETSPNSGAGTIPSGAEKPERKAAPPPPRPKAPVAPPADQGRELWQKAQAAYAQGHFFEPVNDSALHWAILARRAGNPGGKALEEQIDQVYKDRVSAYYKQGNYAAALTLISEMLKFYPGNTSLLADQRRIQAAANSAKK
jgi:serine/threonine protein kinase